MLEFGTLYTINSRIICIRKMDYLRLITSQCSVGHEYLVSCYYG